jgi:twinkle protein
MMSDEDDDLLCELVPGTQAFLAAGVIPGTLCGIESVGRPDVVCWASDVACLEAIQEAGYSQAVALVPAPGRNLFDPLRSHADQLGLVKKFIIAGGERDFVEELARRLGRHRVWRARWPQGCQDACDTAQRHGMQAVRDSLEAADPYPIEGIHRPSAEAMLAFRHAPPAPVLTTGCGATDQIMKFPGEGKLIVVTGIPNHGKSSWMTHAMAHTAKHHSRRWAVFSPEMGEWQNLSAAAMSWWAAKPFRSTDSIPGMTDDEISSGAIWCSHHFTYLACDGEDAAPTLDWLLERAAACVFRDGTTDFVIDPWNEIEHDEGGRSETAYIGRALQRLRAFATRHGCNVWIVAHPTKLKPMKPGEPVPVPTSYDINGGANWANKADMIIVVHCPDTTTQIHLLKARFRRWGRRGRMAELEFDPTTSRFRSAAVCDAARDPDGA